MIRESLVFYPDNESPFLHIVWTTTGSYLQLKNRAWVLSANYFAHLNIAARQVNTTKVPVLNTAKDNLREYI